MRKSPDVSPRRLSDISPQLRQLKYLVVDEAIKEDMKSSRSVEDINSQSIEERILRITGYYGYQPWNAVYNSEWGCLSLLKSFCINTLNLIETYYITQSSKCKLPGEKKLFLCCSDDGERLLGS